MDIIYTDSNWKEIGYIPKNVEIDLEIGSNIFSSSSSNDFQLTYEMNKLPNEIREKSLIYVENEEFGGLVNGIGVDTSASKVYVYGVTWRGLLNTKIIEPPKNEAYLNVNGEANKILSQLINDRFEGLIKVSNVNSNINVTGSFRYTNLLESIETMLDNSNAKLKLQNVVDDNGFHVEVSVVPIVDLSNTIQFDNDYGNTFNAKKINDGYNHLICMGKGELIDRTIIHLYRLEDGTITQDDSKAFKGLDERVETYDYSSVESVDELIEGGIKKLQENTDTQTMSIDINKDAYISDVVSAKDYLTDISITTRISRKIYKGTIDNMTIEVKVGD